LTDLQIDHSRAATSYDAANLVPGNKAEAFGSFRKVKVGSAYPTSLDRDEDFPITRNRSWHFNDSKTLFSNDDGFHEIELSIASQTNGGEVLASTQTMNVNPSYD
jgi:hypothetical protein